MSIVRLISPKKEQIYKFLRKYTDSLKKKNVKKAFLFGSWAKGNYSPYSDLDILIIIESSPYKKMHDRIPDFLPQNAPVGVDIFVFTEKEADKSSFVRKIIGEAMPLI